MSTHRPGEPFPEPEPMMLWRTGRTNRCLRCEMEQIGESCFELRLVRGHCCIICESFDIPEKLFERADELEKIYMRRHRTR